MSSLQGEIERRGERIFELVDQNPESIFTKAGFYQRMMAFSMRDEHFKVQLFRFVDVLASLRNSRDIVRHLEEYFASMRNGSVPFLQAGLRAARCRTGRFHRLHWHRDRPLDERRARRGVEELGSIFRKSGHRFSVENATKYGI